MPDPIFTPPWRVSSRTVARFAPAQGLLLVLVFFGMCGQAVPAARAQAINLRDGQTVQTLGLRRDGANVFARIETQGGNAGEVGYPVANIARIDFPNPPQLKAAGDLLNSNKAAEAAAQLAPVVTYYSPFRDIPGNWWLPLATLQLDALARLGRDGEINALAAELTQAGATNPGLLRTVKITLAAASERRGEHQRALTALEPLVNDKSAPPEELVDGWLAVGSAQLALRNYREALLAFLHVPVYTPDRPLLMAPALLGSGKAYIGLDDKTRAQTTLKQLLADYPNAAEATEARDRLQKLEALPPKPVGG